MDNDFNWVYFLKNNGKCNIRSCYTCNKNFVSKKEKNKKLIQAIRSECFEKRDRRLKSTEDKYCFLWCKFCYQILSRIQLLKEIQVEEFNEIKTIDEKEDLKKEEIEKEKESDLDHDKYFYNRKKLSILDRVKIISMNTNLN